MQWSARKLEMFLLYFTLSVTWGLILDMEMSSLCMRSTFFHHLVFELFHIINYCKEHYVKGCQLCKVDSGNHPNSIRGILWTTKTFFKILFIFNWQNTIIVFCQLLNKLKTGRKLANIHRTCTLVFDTKSHTLTRLIEHWKIDSKIIYEILRSFKCGSFGTL